MRKRAYDEDAWLALETEFSEYDSFLGDDWMATTSPSNQLPQGTTEIPVTDTHHDQMLADTYEKLLQPAVEPEPQQLHGKTLSDRINAIKQYYNKIPTVIKADQLARLHKTACSLYKAGKVSAGNQVVATAESTIAQSFQLTNNDSDVEKTLSYEKQDNKDPKILVFFNNKKTGLSAQIPYNNLFEAIKAYRNL